jgi:vacuolar-type H+-ATPase subunit C/Vma6
MSISDVNGYSVLHAWVRARYSTMLTPETWTQLCSAPSFGALLQVLKGTAYGPFLGKVEEKNLSPRRAVYEIRGHLADICLRIIRLAPKHARLLLAQLYRLYEVDNLKAILRGLVAGVPWNQVRYVLFPLGSSTILPAQSMAEAASVGAAVELLRETRYYDTLAHAMERYATEQSLFPLEVALDLGYWREVWQDVTGLTGRDREQALRIVGSLVDMNNLM